MAPPGRGPRAPLPMGIRAHGGYSSDERSARTTAPRRLAVWPRRAAQTIEREGLRVYEDQPATLPDLIERVVRRYPARPAVREADGPWLDYEGLWLETERVAGTLQQRHGVKPGDQVA